MSLEFGNYTSIEGYKLGFRRAERKNGTGGLFYALDVPQFDLEHILALMLTVLASSLFH
jgi:hypothetical protein